MEYGTLKFGNNIWERSYSVPPSYTRSNDKHHIDVVYITSPEILEKDA